MTDNKVEETTEYESCLDFQAEDYTDVTKFIDGGVQENLIAEPDDSLLTRDQVWKKERHAHV